MIPVEFYWRPANNVFPTLSVIMKSDEVIGGVFSSNHAVYVISGEVVTRRRYG